MESLCFLKLLLIILLVKFLFLSVSFKKVFNRLVIFACWHFILSAKKYMVSILEIWAIFYYSLIYIYTFIQTKIIQLSRRAPKIEEVHHAPFFEEIKKKIIWIYIKWSIFSEYTKFRGVKDTPPPFRGRFPPFFYTTIISFCYFSQKP